MTMNPETKNMTEPSEGSRWVSWKDACKVGLEENGCLKKKSYLGHIRSIQRIDEETAKYEKMVIVCDCPVYQMDLSHHHHHHHPGIERTYAHQKQYVPHLTSSRNPTSNLLELSSTFDPRTIRFHSADIWSAAKKGLQYISFCIGDRVLSVISVERLKTHAVHYPASQDSKRHREGGKEEEEEEGDPYIQVRLFQEKSSVIPMKQCIEESFYLDFVYEVRGPTELVPIRLWTRWEDFRRISIPWGPSSDPLLPGNPVSKSPPNNNNRHDRVPIKLRLIPTHGCKGVNCVHTVEHGRITDGPASLSFYCDQAWACVSFRVPESHLLRLPPPPMTLNQIMEEKHISGVDTFFACGSLVPCQDHHQAIQRIHAF